MRHGRTLLITWLPYALCLAASAVIINVYAVNIANWDEWYTPGMVYMKAATGNVWDLRTFFEFHNDSRPAVPRLLFLLGWHVFGWNPKAWCFINLAIWALQCALIMRLLTKYQRNDPATLFWTVTCLSLFVFHPAQHENLLWGIQLVVFLPSLFLILALSVNESRRPSPGSKVFFAALMGASATFSYASGFLVWLMAFPFFDMRGLFAASARTRIQTASLALIYMLLAIGTMAVYLEGYRPGVIVERTFELGFFLKLCGYGLCWMGNVFNFAAKANTEHPAWDASMIPIAMTGGIILLGISVLTGWCVLGNLRKRQFDFLRTQWAFLVFCLYAIGTGLLTTWGRGPLGIDQAVSSRYYTFAVFLPIGLLGFWYATLAGKWLPCFRAGLVGLSGLLMIQWIFSLPMLEANRMFRKQLLVAVSLIDQVPGNPMLLLAFPNLTLLKNIYFAVRTAHPDTFGIADSSWLGQALPATNGSVSGIGSVRFPRGPGLCEIKGRLLVPDGDLPADYILVASKTDLSRPIFSAAVNEDGRFSADVMIEPSIPFSEICLIAVWPDDQRCRFVDMQWTSLDIFD